MSKKNNMLVDYWQLVGVELPMSIVFPRTDVSPAAQEVLLLLPLPLLLPVPVNQFCPRLQLAPPLTQPGCRLPMAPVERRTQGKLVLDGHRASAVPCTGFVETPMLIVVMGANLVLARLVDLRLLLARLLLQSQTGVLSRLSANLAFLLCTRLFCPTAAWSSWTRLRTTLK